MSQIIKALLIEESHSEASQIQRWLSTAEETYEIEWVQDLKHGLERLAERGTDIVLLNLNLPDSHGVETFVTLYEKVPEVPIVVLAGEHEAERNAPDIVQQQSDGTLLVEVVRHAFAKHLARLDRIKSQLFGKTGRVIGFWEANIGAGITTTAFDVAVALGMLGQATILEETRLPSGKPVCHIQQKQSSRGSLAKAGMPAELTCLF